MQNQNIVSTGSVYKGRTGMWLYLFHRITGVALFGYLLLHIISTALILARQYTKTFILELEKLA